MKSTTYVFSGQVAAPIDDVFALITDPARIPQWLPGCESVKVDGSALRKGSRFRLRLQTVRRTREIQVEVIEYDSPTTFGWAQIAPRSGTKTFFKLQFEGSTTGVTMKHVWAPRGLIAWLRGRRFRERRLALQFDTSLQNVRKLLTR
jgi:uncharacterized protein YndB with AHSA1/START domain